MKTSATSKSLLKASVFFLVFILSNCKNLLITLALFTLTVFNACQEEEELPVANFAISSGELDGNNTDGIVVDIPFSKVAGKPGTIVVTFANAIYGTDFTTLPATSGNSITLAVEPNASSANFKIYPVASFRCLDRYVTLSISSASGGVNKGSKVNYHLTINGNSAAVASFNEIEGTVAENSISGILVHINLSKPAAPGNWTVYVATETETLPALYFTKPGLTCDFDENCKMVLEVTPGATSIEFKVLPFDNLAHDGNSTYVFHLYDLSSTEKFGCILATAYDNKYKLTILDDD